jgi:hypothetical protein
MTDRDMRGAENVASTTSSGSRTNSTARILSDLWWWPGLAIEVEQLKSAITLLWLVCLTVGSLLALFFFVSLGFIPDFTLAELAGAIAAVAAVSLFLVLYFSWFMMLPSIVTNRMLSSDVSPIRDKECAENRVEWTQADEAALGKWFLWWPILLGPAALNTFAIVAIYFGCLSDPFCSYIWSFLCFIAGLLIAIFFGVKRNGDGRLCFVSICHKRSDRINWFYPFVKPVMSSLVWYAVIVITTSILIKAAASFHTGEEEQKALLKGALVLTTVYAVNIYSVLSRRSMLGYKWFLTGAIALLFLMFYTGTLSFVLTAPMRMLGLGGTAAGKVVITDRGCDSLARSVKGGPICVNNDSQQVVELCPVKVRSRLGQQFLLEFAPVQFRGKELMWDPSKKNAQRIALPKTEILAWSVAPEPEPAEDLGNLQLTERTKGVASVHALSDEAADVAARIYAFCRTESSAR